MKLEPGFKRLLLSATGLLYLSGLGVWLLATRFQTDSDYGPEPLPLKTSVLHLHSVVGLVFLGLFGYLWSVHIEPGLKQRKKIRSGWALLSAFIVLFLTVPALFYATHASTRAAASLVHTWLGAILLAPFLIHWRAKRF